MFEEAEILAAHHKLKKYIFFFGDALRMSYLKNAKPTKEQWLFRVISLRQVVLRNESSKTQQEVFVFCCVQKNDFPIKKHCTMYSLYVFYL